MYNTKLIPVGENRFLHSGKDELYSYTVYVGEHTVRLSSGDSAWYYTLVEGQMYAMTVRGQGNINSKYCCTVIRGYSPPNRKVEILNTNLPYINGCSTESLIPPIRLGDPTMQILYMPKHSSEQEEHIHSTARVVHILEGEALCVVNGYEEYPLNGGDTLILDKMVTHHFVTNESYLLCSPLHIFSSSSSEYNHPMFNGTHLTNK